MKPYLATLLALMLGATACTVQVDSQYGLRLAPPAVRNSKAQDDPVSMHGSATLLALAEPTPAAVAELTSGLWGRAAPSAAAAAEATLGPLEPERLTETQGLRSLTEPWSATETHDVAPTAEVEVLETPGEPLPLWAETLLGILLFLLAVGLVVLGGLASVLAVVSFGFGDIAFGWLMVAAAVVGLVGGYLVFRLARPMLPELNFYWLSSPIARLVLGVISLILLIVLGM